MIPCVDLQIKSGKMRDELVAAATRVIDSGWYVLGDELERFEQNFANYCGVDFCVGVGSGLDALSLTLRAWKDLGLCKDGDEVIVPSNAYIATLMAVSENNLTPVLVEPNELTFNLCAKNVQAAISDKTRVVLPIHLYGRLCDMPALRAVAAEHDLLVLEDAAQAHGAELQGKRAGDWGDAGAFSFYPTKNLGALGDAGAIVTSDKELARHIKSLRNYGSEKKYENKVLGKNSRLDEMQAAMLSVKLAYLDEELAGRRLIAEKYIENMKIDSTCLPEPGILGQHTWHQFVIKVSERDRFAESLLGLGVKSDVHYPMPPNKQAAYSQMNHLDYTLANRLSAQVLSLPIRSSLSDDDVLQVISAVNSASSRL